MPNEIRPTPTSCCNRSNTSSLTNDEILAQSTKKISKGDVISSSHPMLIISNDVLKSLTKKTSLSHHRSLVYCDYCTCALKPPNHLYSELPRINLGTRKDNQHPVPCTTCATKDNNPAKVYYCSEECRANVRKEKRTLHSLICPLSSSSFKEYIRELSRLLSTRSDASAVAEHVCFLQLATTILYSSMLFHRGDNDKVKSFISFANASTTITEDDYDTINEEEHLFLEESWVMLRTAILNHGSDDKDHVTMPSYPEFCKCFQFIRQSHLLHLISVPNAITDFISQTIMSLQPMELDKALHILHPYVQYSFRNDYSLEAKEEEDDAPDAVKKRRKAARLLQSASAQECNPLFNQVFYVLCPPTWKFQHSCIPNCMVQLSKHDGHLELIALNDIDIDEEFTVCMVNDIIQEPCHKRRKRMLQRLYGKSFICTCFRCRYEQRQQNLDQKNLPFFSNSNNDQSTPLTISQWKHLGDLAMQQYRFEDAYQIYSNLRKIHTKCNNDDESKIGDVWHASAAAQLSLGNFCKAHELWREAHYQHAPTHSEMALQVQKYEAYNTIPVQDDNNNNESSFQIPLCTSYLNNKCFLTQSPVLSPTECQQVISWAETFAKTRKGGWTTSRHYAVPTTDLPIHDIPPLLSFIHRILHRRLHPLINSQFALSLKQKKMYVHDAFVVRYNAENGQCHLPVHTDESTLSFTIALNPKSEYRGGGTYLCDLGRALRPEMGHVLSFYGGELMHGGDPIVNGVRYIIVAFCYVDRDGEERKCKTAKRFKVDGGFAFNFNL